MAVEMIGGPRLCEPLLATGLGRFAGDEATTIQVTAMGPLAITYVNPADDRRNK